MVDDILKGLEPIYIYPYIGNTMDCDSYYCDNYKGIVAIPDYIRWLVEYFRKNDKLRNRGKL